MNEFLVGEQSLPRFDELLEKRPLGIGRGWWHRCADFFIRGRQGGPAPRGAHEISLHDEKRLMDFLNSGGILANGDSEGVQPDGATVEFVDEGFEQALVHFIQTLGIDLNHRERGIGDRAGDDSMAADLRKVADPAEQCVGDARGAARARGDFQRAGPLDGGVEQAGGALDDFREFLPVVIIQTIDEAETRTQRRGEHAGARRRADEREARQVDLDGSRGGPGIDNDIDPVIFHRGIEVFLDGWMQAVDFIDEKHVALLDVGENAGEVSGFFDLWAGSRVKLCAGGVGDEVGEGGFSEAGRAGEQNVIQHVAALAGGLKHEQQAFLDLFLADEFRELAGAQRDIKGCRGSGGGRLVEIFAHDGRGGIAAGKSGRGKWNRFPGSVSLNRRLLRRAAERAAAARFLT